MKIKPLYIIPARGGSKGIPGKNTVRLAGKPLIAYTIEAALAVADDPRMIIVSTDSPKIAAVAESCGLSIPYMRPAELATDTAGSREVILDVMRFADEHSIDYDAVVLLQPTSPLRIADDIRATLAAYSPDIDMAVTVTEASANPYYNCFETTDDGFLRISKGDGSLTRRQDAPAVYEFNGAVYVINPDSIRHMPLGEFPRRVPVVMPAERSIDIDRPIDLAIAETLLRTDTK